jgi:chemotaxis protein CheD
MSATPRPLPRIVLHPGDCQFTNQAVTYSTLLGSCVAVCLYDPVKRVMGMNHFLLATRNPSQKSSLLESEAGRYGMHAMELLINGVLKLGGKRANLRAKAFGGGNVLGRACSDKSDFMCVGSMNVRFVREFLDNDGIPLVAADLGGVIGRQVHFTGSDFSVYVRAIESDKSRSLVEEERVYWRQNIKAHEHDKQQADFW